MKKKSAEQLEVEEWMALRETEALSEKCGGRAPLSRELLEKWKAICTKAGRKIDPHTAEVDWWYAEVGDPYRLNQVLSDEYNIGRHYFARSPGSDIWVWFGDLP